MTAKKIEKLLEKALAANGEMVHSLYEYELEELIPDLKQSLKQDQDDYIFTVTENQGHIAMALGRVINSARLPKQLGKQHL